MADASAEVLRSLEEVQRRIARAAERGGRSAGDVRLIAVTKGFSAARINEAIAAGVADIGENRVQEAAAKHDEVLPGVNWHLVGHLQTNKAAVAARLFDAVHSLDSERVARALATHRPAEAQPLAALIEVDFTAIGSRTGVRPGDAEGVLRASAGIPGLHVLGLMTIAEPSPDPAGPRRCFQSLRRLRDALEHATGWSLPELSMGMSDDYEVAVEEGATMVRIGRAIFGDRPAVRG